MAPRDNFYTDRFSSAVSQMPDFITSQNRYNTLEGEQDELFSRANTRPRVGGPEATIAALISALPAVIGAALLGDEGFTYGAKGAAEGVGQTFDNLKALGDEEQKAALTEYTRNEKEMTDLRNYMQGIQQQAREKGYQADQRVADQAFTAGQNELNRSAADERARLNRESSAANAGKGAEITAQRKRQDAEDKARMYLSDAGSRAEIKKDLKESLGFSDDKLRILDDPNNPNAVSMLATMIEMRGDVGAIEAKEAYPRLGNRNADLRQKTIENQEADRATQRIRDFRKDFGDDPTIVEIDKKVRDVNMVEDLLSQEGNVNDRQAMRIAASTIQTGVLTDQDAEAGGVTSIFGDLKGLLNYVSNDTNSILTPQQKQAIINTSRIARSRMLNDLENKRDEYRSAAGYLMPSTKPEDRERITKTLGQGSESILNEGAGKTYDYQGGKVENRGGQWFGVSPSGQRIKLNESSTKKVIADLGLGQ